jgi:HSP20 family protein
MSAISISTRGTYRNGDGRAPSAVPTRFLPFHRDMNSFLHQVVDGFGFSGAAGSSAWPVIEVIEREREFRVVAEIPGVDQRDVEVTFDDGVLSIKGLRKAQGGATLYSESRVGSFQRYITVGPDVNADQITAKCANGILTVILPKKPELQPRRIAIE